MISTETVKASSEVFYKYNLWFNDRHAILIGPEGKPNTVIDNIRDITKERLAEKILQQFAHIVATSEDYLALIDRNYTYQAISKAYAQTLY